MSDQLAFVTNKCPHYRTRFFEQLSARLNNDFEVKYIFTDHQKNWQRYGSFDYHVLNHLKVRKRYAIAPSLPAKLFKIDPEVIVAGPSEDFAAHGAYLYAKLTNTPFVLWTGEWMVPKTPLRTTTFPLIKRLYYAADSIVVYGPHIRDYLLDLNVSDNKIYLGWNTTNIARFLKYDNAQVETLRQKLDIPRKSQIILFVGRHVKDKGVHYLIQAYRRLRERVDPTPYLIVVGEGERTPSLKSQASDLENVLFPGYIANLDLPPYYRLADVFVLPSIFTDQFREPWGLVVTEAMASGTPVVTSNQVGIAAAGVVKDGENGYIVPERNSKVLAERIKRLLDDEHLREKMGRRARDTIQKYDYDRMINGFVSGIEHAVEKQHN